MTDLTDREKEAHAVGYGPWSIALLPFAIILTTADVLKIDPVNFMKLVKEKHVNLLKLTNTKIGL